MSTEFDKCRLNNGKMKTISGPNKEFGLEKGEYVRICIGADGKVIRSEVKRKKALAQKVGM